MNKIEITVRVNLIHLKLIFKKTKRKILFTFMWTMRVQLINYSSFSEKKNFEYWFLYKKKCSLSEQCAVEPCSTVEVPFPPREAAKCCFSKPAVQSLILVVLPARHSEFSLTKRCHVWLRVNLTRSHTPKRPVNKFYLMKFFYKSVFYYLS